MPRPLLLLLAFDLLHPADAELDTNDCARDHHDRRNHNGKDRKYLILHTLY